MRLVTMLVLIICCYVTKYPQIQQFKITNLYYLTVSVGRELKNSLAECLWLWVFHKVAVKESAGAAVVSRWEEEGIHFQGQTPGCWQAFSSCWLVTEDFSSLPHGLFFFFLVLLGLHSWHMEVPRLGLNWIYSCQPHHSHSNAGSVTH